MNIKKLLLAEAEYWATPYLQRNHYNWDDVSLINEVMEDWQLEGKDVWIGSDETLCWYVLLLREVV